MFPEIKFGVCQYCGGKGADYPAADLTYADAQDNLDETGNGIPLVDYDGMLVCEMCRDTLENRKESLRQAERLAEEQRFRDNAGFVRTAEE